jgi:YidC/Oxa1 family membrane protein insertase
MDFFGIDLTRVPQYSLAAENLPLLIFPVLAIVTMFISTHISMKASGQQMQGSMKLTMYMMPLMYLFFCFTVPVLCRLQHPHDCAEHHHEEDLRPRKGEG